MLHVGGNAGEGQLASEWLRDLLASVTVTDALGNELATGVVDREGIWRPVDEGPTELGTLPAFSTGQHTVKIHVHRGVKSLAGEQQTLYARYVLCGWERQPALISASLAVTFLLASVCLTWTAMRRRGPGS